MLRHSSRFIARASTAGIMRSVTACVGFAYFSHVVVQKCSALLSMDSFGAIVHLDVFVCHAREVSRFELTKLSDVARFAIAKNKNAQATCKA
jgi:hypothetical protein